MATYIVVQYHFNHLPEQISFKESCKLLADLNIQYLTELEQSKRWADPCAEMCWQRHTALSKLFNFFSCIMCTWVLSCSTTAAPATEQHSEVRVKIAVNAKVGKWRYCTAANEHWQRSWWYRTLGCTGIAQLSIFWEQGYMNCHIFFAHAEFSVFDCLSWISRSGKIHQNSRLQTFDSLIDMCYCIQHRLGLNIQRVIDFGKVISVSLKL